MTADMLSSEDKPFDLPSEVIIGNEGGDSNARAADRREKSIRDAFRRAHHYTAFTGGFALLHHYIHCALFRGECSVIPAYWGYAQEVLHIPSRRRCTDRV
jgi:hypothetical protein